MQGASPLASPGLNPGGTGEGGEPRARRGACPVGRLPALPLLSFLPPIPPTPFPGGEGGDFRLFYARGFAPCIPGLGGARHWGRGRTTRPAGACPLQGGVRGASRCPAAGVPGWLPAKPPFSLLFCPLSPYPPSRREGGDQSFFMQGASPLASPGLGGARHWGRGRFFCFAGGLPPPAPLRLNLYGAGSTLGKQFLSVMPKTFPFNNIIEESP